MFQRYFFLFFISYFLLLWEGCKKDTSPIDNPFMQLNVADVGVTEAWLHLEVKNSNASNQITILRGDSTIQQFSNFSKDSIIYDQGLLPDRSYTYKAIYQAERQTLTAESHLTTMDTTSHDFTWEIYTFGAKGSSVLYDCAIISSDNIWCVGEIYTEDTYTYDSLGNWIEPYNAVHWNGSDWQLKRILYKGGFWTIEAIYAFNENDIWFEPFVHWDGNEFVEQPIPGILIGQSINKMWGTSSDDLYIVGNSGFIAHYNGQTWQRIESGTDLPIQDIWGAKNEKTGEYEILCVASNPFIEIGRKIIKIKNHSARALSDSSITYWLSSVWFLAGQKYYVAGSGIYSKTRNLEKNWKRVGQEIASNYTNSIRGSDRNDIITAGGFGEILHFNGVTWKSYFNTTGLNYGNYYANDINKNLTVSVGSEYQQAIIAVGRR